MWCRGGSPQGRRNPAAASADDRGRDVRWTASDGTRPWRGQRAECGAGTGRAWWHPGGDLLNAAVRALPLFRSTNRQGGTCERLSMNKIEKVHVTKLDEATAPDAHGGPVEPPT